MNSGGEIAELMVKESIQITEESIKLLAAGSKNLAALLWALARDSKKLAGMSSMKRLIREGKELRVFCIRESDLEDFKAYAKKNVLYSIVKDRRAEDGTVDLITNVDYAAQVNLFMERHGYAAPEKEEADPKKDASRVRQGSSSKQRGTGSKASQSRTTDSDDKPSVRGRLAALREASDGMKGGAPARARTTDKSIGTR